MVLSLRQLRIGKVDGKHEYLTPVEERDASVFDAFLMPEAVEPGRMHNGDVFFVEGFRGAGKTSLLRWHAQDRRKTGCITDFVLFKSDLSEVQRMHISKEIGVSWTDIDSSKMEIAQDFKSAWIWFILHKFGENILENKESYSKESQVLVGRIFRLLGFDDDSVLQKAIGFMPRLEGAKIKIRGDVGFFSAELGADLKVKGDLGETTLDSLNRKLIKLLSGVKLLRPIFIYFDELEAFYHTEEQHRRDQRLVRDLLFSVDSINTAFSKAQVPLNVLAAVRSEVIDSMGALGQEVDRLVHDRGFHISWHHANRSLRHPLIQMVSRKLLASEQAAGIATDGSVFGRYFPNFVNGESIDVFLLDRSFYKPRDIVWRLSLAQRFFPDETIFSAKVLHDTEVEYSSKLWDEVRYELSATYSELEIDAIEGAISGGSVAFEYEQIEAVFSRRSEISSVLRSLLQKRTVADILKDLYRLGAIGNSYRAGTTGNVPRSRWSFRGDPVLLIEKRMVIHSALVKRLSVVAPRRRGTR